MKEILVIEDDDSNMLFLSELLKMNGYTVFSASNAEDGIEIAKIKLPKAILMDIELEKMDGLSATKIIKSDTNLSKSKVIILTARAMKGDENAAKCAGADHYLTKPYHYKELLDIISQYYKV